VKLLISASGENIENNIDTTFHWSHCFLIFNTYDNSIKYLENSIKNHPDLIEDTINEFVKNEGIEAVITYEIGSKTYMFFKQHGIKIYRSRGKIIHAVSEFKYGRLLEIKEI
jgi:predicted Fe-Mo cluster-binding NifX family protein